MGGRRNRGRDTELAGIAQPDAISWKQADRQIVPRGGRQLSDDAKARGCSSPFDLADQPLADASPLRYLALG